MVMLFVETDSQPGPLIPILGFFLAGVIGALSLAPFLGAWWRILLASLGFGFGSLFAGLGFILMMFDMPQGVGWIPCLALGFGLTGAIGGACMALGWRVFFRSAAGFAIGGAAGALALLIVQPTVSRWLTHTVGSTQWSGSINTVDFVSFGVTGILLPYVMGGALLGRALAGKNHS
jgi:hypothetical protein